MLKCVPFYPSGAQDRGAPSESTAAFALVTMSHSLLACATMVRTAIPAQHRRAANAYSRLRLPDSTRQSRQDAFLGHRRLSLGDRHLQRGPAQRRYSDHRRSFRVFCLVSLVSCWIPRRPHCGLAYPNKCTNLKVRKSASPQVHSNLAAAVPKSCISALRCLHLRTCKL